MPAGAKVPLAACIALLGALIDASCGIPAGHLVLACALHASWVHHCFSSFQGH
jgi:hypothetical protein